MVCPFQPVDSICSVAPCRFEAGIGHQVTASRRSIRSGWCARRRWRACVKRHHELRRRRSFAGGERDTIGPIRNQGKRIGAIAGHESCHIIFDPGTRGNGALVIKGAA